MTLRTSEATEYNPQQENAPFQRNDVRITYVLECITNMYRDIMRR